MRMCTSTNERTVSSQILTNESTVLRELTGDVELDVPTSEAGWRDLVPGPAGEDGGEVRLGGSDVELSQAGPV